MKTKVGKSVKNEIDISVYKSVSDSSWNLVSGPKHNSSVYSVWISVSDSIKK